MGGFNGSLRVRTVDVYDPTTDTWSQCSSMEARRSTLGVAVLNGCIYAVGGFDGSTGLSSAEVFDIRTQDWRMIATMSTRRSSVGVGVVGELLYAVGGYDGASRQCLSTVERYNSVTNTWSQIAEMYVRSIIAFIDRIKHVFNIIPGRLDEVELVSVFWTIFCMLSVGTMVHWFVNPWSLTILKQIRGLR